MSSPSESNDQSRDRGAGALRSRFFSPSTAASREGILVLVRVLVIVLVIAACSKRGASISSATHDIAFTTSDGYTIAATLYTVDRPKPAGLILVPMLGASRDRWQSFARPAQAEGYLALAIDMRGHGDSTTRNGEKTSYKSFATDDWLGVVNDIAAAKQALLDAGADPDNIAVAGASIGANLALRYATIDPTIQAVVLLSPGKDYHGVTVEDAMAKLDQRPVLLMDSIGDSYSADTANALKTIAKGHCELHEYPGAAHGTDLLDTNENATGQILLWLSAIIGPEAAKANR
jgi:dienelactone hydrolase